MDLFSAPSIRLPLSPAKSSKVSPLIFLSFVIYAAVMLVSLISVFWSHKASKLFGNTAQSSLLIRGEFMFCLPAFIAVLLFL